MPEADWQPAIIARELPDNPECLAHHVPYLTRPLTGALGMKILVRDSLAAKRCLPCHVEVHPDYIAPFLEAVGDNALITKLAICRHLLQTD